MSPRAQTRCSPTITMTPTARPTDENQKALRDARRGRVKAKLPDEDGEIGGD